MENITATAWMRHFLKDEDQIVLQSKGKNQDIKRTKQYKYKTINIKNKTQIFGQSYLNTSYSGEENATWRTVSYYLLLLLLSLFYIFRCNRSFRKIHMYVSHFVGDFLRATY